MLYLKSCTVNLRSVSSHKRFTVFNAYARKILKSLDRYEQLLLRARLNWMFGCYVTRNWGGSHCTSQNNPLYLTALVYLFCFNVIRALIYYVYSTMFALLEYNRVPKPAVLLCNRPLLRKPALYYTFTL
ncbi:hypothetical protein PUN28_002499 [Cardiocondyla obscurior]|uniref:Uncharacterized protein n=1 Tax=Cardiocondyla obscurior TaxID=286306 RepID=A0AAW2GUG8_9HYME